MRFPSNEGGIGVWQSAVVRPLAALYRVIFGSETDPALRPILGINFAGSLAGSTVWSFVGIWAIKKLGRTLRPTEDSVVYWLTWRAPRRRLLGRFCVRAADGAGNTSISCAALRVR